MKIRVVVSSFFATLLLAGVTPARADTKCKLNFHLEGWSAFYKTAKGGGRVTCGNGQSARVVIQTRGGGITFGRSKIVDGVGDFSPVASIDEVFGDYANAEAHAGAGESSDAQVVTKGTVSLALSGKGHGIDLGISFGRFTIAHAAAPRRPGRSRHVDGPQHVDEAPLDDTPSAPRHGDPPPSGAAY
jgi:hypothetical protein